MVVVVSDIVERAGVQCVISKAGVEDSKTFRHRRREIQLWRWVLERHIHNRLTRHPMQIWIVIVSRRISGVP